MTIDICPAEPEWNFFSFLIYEWPWLNWVHSFRSAQTLKLVNKFDISKDTYFKEMLEDEFSYMGLGVKSYVIIDLNEEIYIS